MRGPLLDATRAGVYQAKGHPGEIEGEARHAGLDVYRIELEGATNKKEVLSRIATALRFPSYFGGNLDALHDCLTDLEWVAEARTPPAGVVLLILGAKRFATRHADDFEACLSALESAAEFWRERGWPFWVFIHSGPGWRSREPEWPPPDGSNPA